MFIGFDYGTANCSVAVMEKGSPRLLPLENNSPWLPSMLCAPTREAISEWLFRHHQVATPDAENQALLRRAIAFNREEDIEVNSNSVQFGLASLAQYMDDPEEVWFVKSPKSFLGASGLKPQQIALFEDLVCAMMLHIRKTAENQLGSDIQQAVIGRPINFQGLGGEDANHQAQGILERAAHRAGFRDVVFQFEPVAAGLDFEATLQKETRVLVVDIGGGTTDCSMLLMGPEWSTKAERGASLLGHSGCRVGGNDLDIMLAFKELMPLLGLGGQTAKGIALPALPWWNAVAINDVPAQSDFYAAASRKMLQDLIRDAQQPEVVKRLLKVWQQRLSYRLVRSAEESKIALSDSREVAAALDFIEPALATSVSVEGFQAAITQPLERIQEQVKLALATSGTRPDVIYLTGGSARSPLLRQALQQQLPDIPLATGDDFGSVTAGLARWAQVTFAG
ncbi:molecular chaperone [Winslowiella toletana]|uniref:molecular chaperone n=1 Tax=Winslowiella toletana TaxID=92490 RepID=UPI0028BE36DC|nr:molecular chaperone [Winslowiella toletana]WNN42989.1 molecular chaperone [Winslowiella toletana]